MKQTILKLNLVFSVLTVLTVNSLQAQSNQYLDFDGVDDFTTTDNASQLIANSPAISMTGWFYDHQLSYGQGMMGLRATSAGFYMIELNNGVIECRFVNSANTLFEYVTPEYTIVPQVWQHYAWVYDGSTITLYLNGNVVGSNSASGTITNTTTQFAIGKSILSGFNFVYNGRIDEVSLWSKALSQTEIQNMIVNELTGTEPDLQLYYKFNQGVPGGDNTSISSLLTEVNSPTYDGTFNNFALNGPTSNFNGTLDSSFQAISFPQIPPQLTTSPPYILNAIASSGLPVVYTLLSGPAIISGDSVTFTGAGTVQIQADQPGDAQYDPAVPVINIFDVVDPNLNLAAIDPRNPLPSTDIYMPELGTLELAAIATIPYPELFTVTELKFVIEGQTYPGQPHTDGHYTAWWTPAAYGTYSIQITATSNFGAYNTATVDVNVVQAVTDINDVSAFSGIWLDSGTPSITVDGVLPSYVGAFDTIIATLTVTCPSGGCGPWDRVASIDAQGKDGQWFEIIRYITPYGVPCSHTIDLADYMSILQGKVSFRANCATLDNGFLYALKFDFKEGAPPHKYSRVAQVWKAIYPFGDYSNLQPVPIYNFSYPALAVASKLKLVSTGHGWGTLNTGNAAEFYDATHSIWVNGGNTFSQHNWTICNPNPDGCSPQNGTWTYSRAGWCPGAIARYFDYDMTSFIPISNVSLEYEFYSSYLDECHPNNPDCVTGVTCSDCSDGFNPTLDVNCNLVTFFDDASTISIDEIEHFDFGIYPNPSTGIFIMSAVNVHKNYSVTVFDVVGNAVKQFNWEGQKTTLDLSNCSKGVYLMKVSDHKETQLRKVIIQ